MPDQIGFDIFWEQKKDNNQAGDDSDSVGVEDNAKMGRHGPIESAVSDEVDDGGRAYG